MKNIYWIVPSLLGLIVTWLFPNESHASLAILPALIAAGAAIGSGAAGAAASSADRRQALELAQQSIRDYEALGVPTLQAQQLVLQKYRSAGTLTPELEQAVTQGPSNFNNISVNPDEKAAQLQALSKLGEIGDQGGMTLTDKANLEKTLGEAASQAKGQRGAIMARQAANGMTGSGMGLAAQLQGQQASQQQAHSDALSVAADARQRALQSIMQGGQLAGTMRTQDFGEQAQKASAQDAIDKFNAGQTQAVQQRNVNRSNDAQQENLTAAQKLSNSNTDISNKEQTYNKGLYQQQFNNQLSLDQAKANARAGQASSLNAAAQRASDSWGNIGSGVAKAATAYGTQAAAGQGTNSATTSSSDPTADEQKKRAQQGQYNDGF